MPTMWMRPGENRVEIEDFLLETFPGERIEKTFPSRAGANYARENRAQRRSLVFRIAVSVIPLVFGICMFLGAFQGDYEPFAGGILLVMSLLTFAVAVLTYVIYKRRELRPAEKAPILEEYLGISSDGDILIAHTHLLHDTTIHTLPAHKVHVEPGLSGADASGLMEYVQFQWESESGHLHELRVYPIDRANFIATVRSRMSDLKAGATTPHHNRHHHSPHAEENSPRDDEDEDVEEDDTMKINVVVPIQDGTL